MLGWPIGELNKTNKATVIHELEKGVAPIDTVPRDNAGVIDGMPVLWMLNAQQHKCIADHISFSN